MPNDKQINDLRVFIKNYYKKGLYLRLFETTISENKKLINRPVEDNYKSDDERLKILSNVIGKKNNVDYTN